MPELAPSDYEALVEALVHDVAAALRSTGLGPRAPSPVEREAGHASPPRDPRQLIEIPSRSRAALAPAIESTLLAAETTAADIEHLCREAVTLGVAAVCVAPVWVALAASELHATPVAVVAAVGFPLGASTGSAKVFEAAECLKLGADELDVVISLGALKSGADVQVQAELEAIVALAHAAGGRVKAILEMGLLTPTELERACTCALDAGVDFVKNGTGFGPTGATPDGIARLRALVGSRARIKAAGGIRTAAQARPLLDAGAVRVGTSAAAAVLS